MFLANLVTNSTNNTHRVRGMLSCRPKTEHFDTVAVHTHKKKVVVTEMYIFVTGGWVIALQPVKL